METRQGIIELRKYLGEDNSKTAPWKKQRGYKAKGKCFGAIASGVNELAEKAADEEDVVCVCVGGGGGSSRGLPQGNSLAFCYGN